MTTLDIVLWISLALAAYAFAGYPALAIALSRRRARPTTQYDELRGATVALRPPLTVVIAARNEAVRIVGRVRNILDSRYPPDHIEVVVADDGSTDGTAEAVRGMDDAHVRVVRLPRPSGKAAALNAAMAEVRTPLTVFADARQRFVPGALAALAEAFGDRQVGAAAGELVLTQASPDGDPVAANGAYWRLERSLRDAESRLGWAHAASGAIYAIRTPLFRTLPAGLLLDDVYTPMQVVREGFRVQVVREAIAHEPAGTDLGREFRRKLRTLTGNWQLVALQPWLLDPLRNPVWFAWTSHKLARLLAPWALLAALLSAAFAQGPVAQAAFWLQTLAYAVALATVAFPAIARRVPLAGTAGSFLTLNAAALLSLPMYLGRRDLGGLWKR